MADILDRLKAALADRYRIERELGSGGMATVYLAQDLKHERQVAVKVLRPELAAALGPERFHQEIKIAANLTHPHILPLHDSGDADGFLYYVMPHIEGESLRDKLAHEGELPIGGAVRILRDVVDALSEAHAKGVVHRDIKPDNVLLTKHHALVTDFGVAKAVSEATGAHKLTTEGVALGTPAYMSPEQAAADKHIDHRADIYAVGALAYELLTGRPPFTGITPQEVLSAHVTQAPDPVTKYRGTVPPALAQLVMKCLEKKPADRWQTAEELLPQLEALATPSGGVTPTGIIPVGQAAKRRWMLAGAAVAAVAILALVIGVWLGGAEPEGPPSLVVLPFENLGAAEDEYFADGITEEITSRLARVSGLNVIARSSAMQYKDSEKNLRQIADELNVDYLLEGTVRWSKPASGESRVRVSPQLIRGSDEMHVWAEPFEAELTDVFVLQADLAERVAAGMHVVLQPEETEAIEAPPTENLAAYDAYLRGLEYYQRGTGQNWEAQLLALEMFDSAAALDPDFALARVMRANAHLTLDGSGYDVTLQPEMVGAPRLALAKAAIDDAARLDPELAEVQKALGWYYWRLHDSVRAEEQYAAALRQQPNDVEALLWLAYFQTQRGEWDSAEVSLKKAGNLDPRSAETADVIRATYTSAGKYEDAMFYADRCVSLAADQPRPYLRKAVLHVHMGDTASAHQVLQLGAERVGLVNLLVDIARAEGEMWFRMFDEYSEVIRGLSQDAFGVDTVDYLFAKAHSHHESPDLARPYFDSLAVWASAALQASPDEPQFRAMLAQAYAGIGRKEAAIEQAEALMGIPPGSHLHMLVEALVMLGEHDAAVEQLRLWLSYLSVSPSFLRFDPLWDPLRDHPGFQELLAGGN